MSKIFKNILKKFYITLKIVIIISCASHICFLFYNTVHPELPEIKVYQKGLDEIEFPLSFLVCVHEMVHVSGRYRRLGYSDYIDFYYGQSRFNGSIYGWGGHMENGTTYGSVEGNFKFKYYLDSIRYFFR